MEQKELYFSESQRFCAHVMSFILFCVGVYIGVVRGLFNLVQVLDTISTTQSVFEDVFCSLMITMIGIGTCFYARKIAYECVHTCVKKNEKVP